MKPYIQGILLLQHHRIGVYIYALHIVNYSIKFIELENFKNCQHIVSPQFREQTLHLWLELVVDPFYTVVKGL